MNKKLHINVTCSEVVNFAMQQNHIPVIRQLFVKNISEEELHDLTVTVTTDPAFALEWKTDVASIAPNQTIEINTVGVRLSASYLYSITERINGSVFLTVSQGNEVIEQNIHDISVLAYDEWSGGNIIPEIISAFVTPNHPYIVDIIKNASQLLQKWDGDPSFTGYQRKNPNAVRKQLAAIYGSLQKENIAYCMPPASFEEAGQRVRLCDAIKTQKLGTCLDLTLLYASCIEYVGLHPLIVMLKGHAFVGCWLEEECFPECVQDDVSMLTKRTAPGINEICLVESTCFTAEKNVGFESAVLEAEHNLSNLDNFIYFVDIKRSRGSKIRPLPIRISDSNGNWSFESSELEDHVTVTDAPEELELMGKLKQTDRIDFTRQQMWERKLLDLSLRNTLLNFRVTKSSIQLLADSLTALEDALSDGEEFQIMHRPKDFEDNLRDSKIYELENNESMVTSLIKTEFANHRIRTFLDEKTLASAITLLYRSAKSSLEENGANTLYLALGFLKWFETDLSEKARYSPLVLIPVDIVRKSVQRGYVIRLRDEEPQFNITLLEMLRADFGLTISGLDPLPTDNSGIDLKLIFNIVRQAVMGKTRWDVENLAFIGIFSFNQFIMWNDIRNRAEDLKKNKVVSSLMSGVMEWEAPEGFPEPETLDDTISPLDMAVPVSADSSQLSAICAAGKGNTFVLHGPPGTGKSQTITNMIANALYQGKSVLFIAEKMAALSVVQRRLEAIGLGPFCLELHSNKAKKKDVIGQLDKTLGIGRIKKPEAYAEQADRLHVLRSELNDMVRTIHKQQTYGFSLYDTIVRAEQYKDYPDCVSFSSDQIQSLTFQQYTEWVDICGQIQAAGTGCGRVYNHPLREIKNSGYSQALKADISVALTECIDTVRHIKDSIKTYADELKIGAVSTFRQIESITNLCSVLSEVDMMPVSLLESRELPLLSDKVSAVCNAGIRRDEVETQLMQTFNPSVLSFNSTEASLLWQQAQSKWFLARLLTQGKIVKLLKLNATAPKAYIKANTPAYLSLITEYQSTAKVVEENATIFSALYGVLWNSGKCNWKQIQTIYNQATKILKSISSGAADIEKRADALHVIKDALLNDIADYKERHHLLFGEIIEKSSKLIHLEVKLSEYFKTNFSVWHDDVNWLDTHSDRLARWSENIEDLRDWCSYLLIKEQAVKSGLSSLIMAFEDGKFTEHDILPTFYRNISQACASAVVSENKTLSSFNGTIFEQKIQKFRDTCSQFEMLTRQELVAKLSANVPVLSSGVSNSSEIGILQRAIRSGGRMLSVRKLFDSIPNLLRSLCPCMLMSPISVSQYIDPKYPPFDLVIFDEASQMPTCEAVGAIARGNNLVVVGDPKQLPPTSFFSTNRVDEENYDKEDLESVLDDCLALSMPQEHLLWHYRSRHESLIAFSNRQYYDNKLYTFPSPNDLVSEVKHIAVQGYYDRGRTKQNKAEAEAVVKEIVRRLRDPKLSKLSMGVVTFSSVQQSLIEDMLDEEFSKHPELEEINNAAYEPLFVKNLENVQGDERDIIMFSIGYGPDDDGKVALNFGPLNRDGGWRRLNVAVSRARMQMLVFSVLKPEQIDLSKTRSDGLAGLKAFLEFAIRGKSVLTVKQADTADSQGIEEIIAKKLRELSLDVTTNIGCSEYKIDIGIVNPRRPGEYILGIMSDGDRYNHSGTSRDRNILQESVLKSLGWNVHRVWILDWWENPGKEISRIQAAVTEALSGNQIETREEPVAPKVEDYERIDDSNCAPDLPTYTLCSLTPEDRLRGNSEEFAQPYMANHISSQLAQVLEVEAPISRSVLCKRVLDAWGISRMGSRIDRTFDGILSKMKMQHTNGTNATFYWNPGQNIAEYATFRVPAGNEQTRRNMEDIAPEEIAAAAKYVLQLQYSLTIDDFVKEIALLFGFSRCTSSMQSIIKQGMAVAVQKGYAEVDGDRLSCPKK